MKIYEGLLNEKKGKMPFLARKAYMSYLCQRRRCYVKSNARYKTYGAKGIRVKYTAREYIGWYMESFKDFRGKFPCVGRIEHSKDYCFSNIRFEEIADNSREAITRNINPTPRRAVILCDLYSDEPLMYFKSCTDAARFIDSPLSGLCAVLNGSQRTCGGGKGTTGKGFFFKYA